MWYCRKTDLHPQAGTTALTVVSADIITLSGDTVFSWRKAMAAEHCCVMAINPPGGLILLYDVYIYFFHGHTWYDDDTVAPV